MSRIVFVEEGVTTMAVPAPREVLKQLRAVMSHGSAAQRLQAAAAHLQGLDQRYATCMIWRRVGNELALVADAGQHHEECPLPAGGGISRQAVQRGEQVVVGNNRAAERSLECYLFAGSELAMPIAGPEGRAVGAVHLQSEQLEAFAAADSALLQSVAALIGGWL